MEDKKTLIMLERHEEKIKNLQRELGELREVQAEIRNMNEALVTLANELKHTNEHLARHETRIEEIEEEPRRRWNQLVYAIIGTIVGVAFSWVIGLT